MSPSEYAAHVNAWRKRERRKAEYVATLAMTINRSLGGSLEVADLLEPEANE